MTNRNFIILGILTLLAPLAGLKSQVIIKDFPKDKDETLLSGQWEKFGELSAEEATQAAAATKSHVYAINNGQVAQYNRGTGEKTALSSGKASHLNSGFFLGE